ncbi:MAG: hypothetical protein R2991_02430 [Thermoanaerobaculia bacterium]
MELERTVATLVPRVLRYCGATRSWELAEDVAQEALTAVVHRWRTTGPPDSPIAFALVVARRRLAARSVQAAGTESLDGLDAEIETGRRSERPRPGSTSAARSPRSPTCPRPSRRRSGWSCCQMSCRGGGCWVWGVRSRCGSRVPARLKEVCPMDTDREPTPLCAGRNPMPIVSTA